MVRAIITVDLLKSLMIQIFSKVRYNYSRDTAANGVKLYDNCHQVLATIRIEALKLAMVGSRSMKLESFPIDASTKLSFYAYKIQAKNSIRSNPI